MNDPRKLKRVLLKISGEMMGGSSSTPFDTGAMEMIAGAIAKVHDLGLEVAVVIGGGNIFRGSTFASKFEMDRAGADYMGMLATCINGLALQAVLENWHKVNTRVMTAIRMHELAEPYIRRKAIKHLEAKRVAIFAGGTGNPLFTTDTAARALETECDMILKATRVDGIYDCDPENTRMPRNSKVCLTWTLLQKNSKSWTQPQSQCAWKQIYQLKFLN